MKTFLTISACFMASIGLSHAVVVTWQTPQTIVGSNDVNVTGNTVYARNIGLANGNASAIVNGVNFGYNNPAWSIGFAESFSNINTFASATPPGMLGPDAANYGAILANARFAPTAGDFTLSNLVINQDYLIQLWVGDYRNAFAIPARTETITANASTSAAIAFGDSTGTIHGQYVIGTFTADATSLTFSIAGNNVAQYNALQLRTVPEPTSAALLGLGSLALLIRRRK